MTLGKVCESLDSENGVGLSKIVNSTKQQRDISNDIVLNESFSPNFELNLAKYSMHPTIGMVAWINNLCEQHNVYTVHFHTQAIMQVGGELTDLLTSNFSK